MPSAIVLSWCHNINIKLCTTELRPSIGSSIGHLTPILFHYHVEGSQNLADLLTKPHEITPASAGEDSLWQTGHHWMTLPSAQLPLVLYDAIKVKESESQLIKTECYQTPFFLEPGVTNHTLLLRDGLDKTTNMDTNALPSISLTTSSGPPSRTPFVMDLMGKGWFRSRQIIKTILSGIDEWKHKCQSTLSLSKKSCPICNPDASCPSFEARIDTAIFQYETKMTQATVSPSAIKRFILVDEILLCNGRLSDDHQLSANLHV